MTINDKLVCWEKYVQWSVPQSVKCWKSVSYIVYWVQNVIRAFRRFRAILKVKAADRLHPLKQFPSVCMLWLHCTNICEPLLLLFIRNATSVQCSLCIIAYPCRNICHFNVIFNFGTQKTIRFIIWLTSPPLKSMIFQVLTVGSMKMLWGIALMMGAVSISEKLVSF
jgi:hypothetical protein